MYKKIILILALVSFAAASSAAEGGAVITRAKGDVKVRYGMDEAWKTASAGLKLKDIDTILTGEGAEVTLRMPDGKIFTMGRNSILDIGDLRKIVKKELFLYLVSNKIQKITPASKKTKLQIGTVSVVRAEQKSETVAAPVNIQPEAHKIREINGALALYKQQYYPNTIIKLHKVMRKYGDKDDCGRLHFYMGKSFKEMDMDGQAADSFQAAVDSYKEQKCENSEFSGLAAEAEQELKNLNK